MGQYLIDTNAVSDYLSASLPATGIDLMDRVIDAVPNLSVISKIELLCWDTDNSTTENVESFISDSLILDINEEAIKQCVAVRKGKRIKTPDTIIAGTALAYNLVHITANEKDLPISMA